MQDMDPARIGTFIAAIAILLAIPLSMVANFQRNGVRLQTGIAFTFDRIPQEVV